MIEIEEKIVGNYIFLGIKSLLSKIISEKE
jgi:hypothetical protein